MKVLAALALVLTCSLAAVFRPSQARSAGRLLKDFDSEKTHRKELAKKDVPLKLPKYGHAGLIRSSRVNRVQSKRNQKIVKKRQISWKPERKLNEGHHGGHEESNHEDHDETGHHESAENHGIKKHESAASHNKGRGHELSHSGGHGSEEDEHGLQEHHSYELPHDSVMKARIHYPDLGLVNLEKGTYLFKIT